MANERGEGEGIVLGRCEADGCGVRVHRLEVVEGRAIRYPRSRGKRALLCLCPDHAERYRQATDAVPVKAGSRPREPRHRGQPRAWVRLADPGRLNTESLVRCLEQGRDPNHAGD